MTSMSPDEARAALYTAEHARHSVAAEVGLPRAYWWAMAAGWIVLGVIGAYAAAWVTMVATVLFGAGHAILASRLLDGRRRSAQLEVARSVADRRIPSLVIAILVLAVAATVGLALLLDADGAAHPALWSAGIIAVTLGLGGPTFLSTLRRWLRA